MPVKKKTSSSYLSPHERLLQKAMHIKPFTKEDAEEKIGRLVRIRFDRGEPKGTRGKVIGTRRGLIDSSDVSEWGYRGWVVVVAWSVRGKARREDLFSSRDYFVYLEDVSRREGKKAGATGRRAKEALQKTDTPTITHREEWTRCNNERCKKCKESPGHGPYWYAYWREGGKVRKKYLGKTRPDA